MVAADYPLIRLRRTRNRGNDVVNRLDVPVKLNFEMDSRRPWPHVIRDGQAAPPLGWPHWPFERGQQGLCVPIGYRENRDFRDCRRVFDCETLGIRGCAYIGSERITRIKWHVHYTATLDTVRGPHGAFGESVSIKVAILLGVGVDQTANGAVFSRNFGLNPSPRFPIARNYDGVFDGNSQPFQCV